MTGEFSQVPANSSDPLQQQHHLRVNSQTQRQTHGGQILQVDHIPINFDETKEKDFFESRKFSQAGSENFHLYSQTQL